MKRQVALSMNAWLHSLTGVYPDGLRFIFAVPELTVAPPVAALVFFSRTTGTRFVLGLAGWARFVTHPP
jgi:hypothetical protein